MVVVQKVQGEEAAGGPVRRDRGILPHLGEQAFRTLSANTSQWEWLCRAPPKFGTCLHTVSIYERRGTSTTEDKHHDGDDALSDHDPCSSFC